MDALIGRSLVKVVRLAWHWADEPDDLSVGPVQLVFDDGRSSFAGVGGHHQRRHGGRWDGSGGHDDHPNGCAARRTDAGNGVHKRT
jgi:hypothetical protein